MGKYVEKQLTNKEKVILKARISYVTIFTSIFCFRFFRNLIDIATTELAFTNKNVIGKTGFIRSGSLSSPLNKIQNINVSSGLGGKIFKYGTIKIQTAGGQVVFHSIKDAEGFKQKLLAQMDIYEDERIQQQASAMAGAINHTFNR